MNKIGDKIRNIRELKNLTQEYMAGKLGITQAGYSKIETGTTKVSYSKLADISKILEVEVDDLLAFDSQKYFNSFNNIKGNNSGSVTIKLEDDDLKPLYEDKIRLLERILEMTKEELRRYKDRYGDF